MDLKTIKVNLEDEFSMDRFRCFFSDIIIPGFNEDERETYDQFIEHLKQKEDEESSYEIILTLDRENNVLGGIVCDYFADVNAGFIEYIATNPNAKQHGIGTYTLAEAVKHLNGKAIERGHNRVDFIGGEVEKQINGKQAKHYFWEKYGFMSLDFTYIQPALDEDKNPVYIMDFGIMTKIPGAEFDGEGLSKEKLKLLLADYIDMDKYKQVLSRMHEQIDSKPGNFIRFTQLKKENDRDEER